MSVTEFYNKGNDLDNSGRYGEAIEWYNKALRINPNHVDTLCCKGLALNNLGRHQEAIKWFDKVLRINPNDANALCNKGQTLYNLSRHQEAIECYDKVLRINPNDAITLGNKGSALDDLGRHVEAIEWYDKALRVNPNDAITLGNKGSALDDLGQHEQAIEWFDKAIRIKPDYTLALNNKKAAQDAMKSRIPKSSVASNSNLHDELSALNINLKNNNKTCDVFISYSWKQKPQARNLYNFLTQSGVSCWMDDNQLQAGNKLSRELADAIYNSKLVIFCISKEYLNSLNCQREFDYSFKFKKSFIPVLFCKNKKDEFGEWPCHHEVFFTLGDALYVSDIFNDLDTSNTNTSGPLDRFIIQVKQKL